MIDFIKRLFGFSAKPVEVAPSAPYKVPEPAATTPIPLVVESVPVVQAEPAKAPVKAPAKPKAAARTAKPKAPAKAKAPKAKAPAKPRAPKAKPTTQA
jgi:hypothetical protein